MKTRIIALAALAAITLSGCGASTGSTDTTETNPACVASIGTSHGDLLTCTIELPDTRLATCLVYDSYYSGSIDCDWAHASGADTEPGR